jgi:hypothetical protein
VEQVERSAASKKVVSDGSRFNPRELTVTKTTEVVAGKQANHKRGEKFERTNHSVSGKTLEGKSQGRDQHEIRLADKGWMKALRV